MDSKENGSQKTKKEVTSEKKFKSDLYDALYKTAEIIIKKYNPCCFNEGKCFMGNDCCDGCPYLSNSGCTVKVLNCKLYLCDEARTTFPACTGDLDALLEIAGKHGLLGYRKCKKDVI